MVRNRRLRIPKLRLSLHRKVGILVLVINLDLAVYALIGAKTLPLGLYEPNLYFVVSPATWLLLGLAFVMPLTLFCACLASSSLSKELTRWLVASLIVANVGFLLVPWVRYPAGYDRWDSWYHLAETKIVLQSGHFSGGNVYPATHLLLASLTEICGIPPGVVFRFFPAFLGALTLMIAYAACELIGIDYVGAFIGVVGLSALLYLPLVLPFSLSLLFLIMSMSVVLRERTSLPYRVIFATSLSALVFSHLLTAISLLVGLAAVTGISRGRWAHAASGLMISFVLIAAWIFLMTRVYLSPIRVISQIVATGSFGARDYAEIRLECPWQHTRQILELRVRWHRLPGGVRSTCIAQVTGPYGFLRLRPWRCRTGGKCCVLLSVTTNLAVQLGSRIDRPRRSLLDWSVCRTRPFGKWFYLRPCYPERANWHSQCDQFGLKIWVNSSEASFLSRQSEQVGRFSRSHGIRPLCARSTRGPRARRPCMRIQFGSVQRCLFQRGVLDSGAISRIDVISRRIIAEAEHRFVSVA